MAAARPTAAAARPAAAGARAGDRGATAPARARPPVPGGPSPARWKPARGSWLLLLCLACEPGPDAPALDLPPRPGDALGGTDIVREIRELEMEAREERIFAEVARGNVPAGLRHLERIEMTGEADGRRHRLTFWATRDYLSVGSDTDYFLIPLSPRTAQRIADLVGGSLPAPAMVDAVWAAARFRLAPIRIRPDEYMGTVRYFRRHDRMVQAQQVQQRVPPGSLIAGHRLDVVVTTPPGPTPGEFAVYGWHQRDGTPIQPLYPVETESRPHFSMGLRLVHREILVDGVRRELADVLRDPDLGPLLKEVLPIRGS